MPTTAKPVQIIDGDNIDPVATLRNLSCEVLMLGDFVGLQDGPGMVTGLELRPEDGRRNAYVTVTDIEGASETYHLTSPDAAMWKQNGGWMMSDDGAYIDEFERARIERAWPIWAEGKRVWAVYLQERNAKARATYLIAAYEPTAGKAKAKAAELLAARSLRRAA